MKELRFENASETYLINQSGLYLYSDLRHELTAEVIVDGINEYMNKSREYYRDNPSDEHIQYVITGLSSFIDKSYVEDEELYEIALSVLDGMVSYLNHVYLQEYYDPILDTENILVDFFHVDDYSSLMMNAHEREWIHFFHVTCDPKIKRLYVEEVDKEKNINCIKEIYLDLREDK